MPGRDERQGDPAERRPPVGAERGGGVLEARVGGAQRALHADHQERHRHERLGDHDGGRGERDGDPERARTASRRGCPCRPSTRNSATPPTTGGSTSGTVTSARSTDRPRIRERASTQASGTPSTIETAVASVAESSDSRSAWPTSGCGQLRADASTTAPGPPARPAAAPGRRPPSAAGTSRGSGTPPFAAGGPRCGLTARGSPASVERLLPGVGLHQVDERLRGLRVRRRLQHADRVVVDLLLGLGERDALDVGPGRLHVGGVDQRGVDLAQLHLGQRRLDVLLLGVGHAR